MIPLQITKYLCRIIILVPALILGQISGIKSIGTGGDYTTFSTAANALSNYGVDGPVTFNVLNGTYDGDFSLSTIPVPAKPIPLPFNLIRVMQRMLS